jgi:CxxC motif-containing protein (DUF1111 family)
VLIGSRDFEYRFHFHREVAMRRFLFAGLLTLAGCGGSSAKPPLKLVGDDPTDVPLATATADQTRAFNQGDATFDIVYLAPDGLGPNYVRSSCSSCHQSAGKGPGSVQKMALVDADGVTPLGDQSALSWGHTVRPYVAGGATTPLLPPANDARVKLSLRLGVPVFGRGYLDAIDDAEIERVEAEQAQRADAIHGRINRVTFASVANPDTRYHHHYQGETNLVGRFGLKARIATIDDFVADAAQGDMSITSPMRPDELPNPDGKTDDAKPGVDITIDAVNQMADYMRMLAIPARTPPAGDGAALFAQVGCATCHVPSLHTRADYPIAQLANIDAPIFSDLLLHDMGNALADGLTDGSARSQDWRTAPLIGLRHFHAFLHDGRAPTVEAAILAHDGEAAAAAAAYRGLSDADRAALLAYVSSL